MKKFSNQLVLIQFLLLVLFFQGTAKAQEPSGLRVEPPFWWTGMKHQQLQLMLYGPLIAQMEVKASYPGMQLLEKTAVENPNYLFLTFLLSDNIRPGSFTIDLMLNGKKKFSYLYELRGRDQGSAMRRGFTPADVVYLLMPDRFANGDAGNDAMPGMLEKPDRLNPSGRHGGDIAGIRNHLPYLSELGVTALWINPLLENNNVDYTYHGYAITDFYKIDARYGSNQDYVNLVKDAHSQGLKVIMDMIFNHCGINHWFINDLPMSNWIHQFPEYTRSNFRAEALTDIHGAEADRNRMLQGWFDRNMPDLDQRNPLLHEYLIQNSIWWIEFAGLDGIRLDTQPYPYKEMITEWSQRVFEEYPGFSLVGEAWLQRESMTSYYQKDSPLGFGYNSGVPSVTDFPLYFAMNRAFTENEGWSEGLARLYYVLAQDFLYSNPYNLLIFLDNHDLNRYFNTVGNDMGALKMASAFLLTTRGIPQIYYGTELLMDGKESNGHGDIRRDFPGGWAGDSLNAFEANGRTSMQNEYFSYLQRLLKWRKGNAAVTTGKLLQFIPENGIYVYFRYTDDATVMVVINRNNDEKALSTARFSQGIGAFRSATDVLTGRRINLSGELSLPARTATILELN